VPFFGQPVLRLRIYALVHLLIYLHTQFLVLCVITYKTVNISETVEDRVKATINRLYKVAHWLSIAAKMYDLKRPISDIQHSHSLLWKLRTLTTIINTNMTKKLYKNNKNLYRLQMVITYFYF